MGQPTESSSSEALPYFVGAIAALGAVGVIMVFYWYYTNVNSCCDNCSGNKYGFSHNSQYGGHSHPHQQQQHGIQFGANTRAAPPRQHHNNLRPNPPPGRNNDFQKKETPNT